jgi:hypothetical protein
MVDEHRCQSLAVDLDGRSRGPPQGPPPGPLLFLVPHGQLVNRDVVIASRAPGDGFDARISVAAFSPAAPLIDCFFSVDVVGVTAPHGLPSQPAAAPAAPPPPQAAATAPW